MCEKTNRKHCHWTKNEDALILRNVAVYNSKQEAFGATAKELKGRTRMSIAQRYYRYLADFPNNSKPVSVRTAPVSLKATPIVQKVEPLHFGKRGQIVLNIKGIKIDGNKLVIDF